MCHGPISELYATSRTVVDGSCHNLASHVLNKKTASTTYYVCALVCSKLAHPEFWLIQEGKNGNRRNTGNSVNYSCT